MTKAPPKDVDASVRTRLLRLSRERGEDFQLLLIRYANERLLFRLASSRHAQRFVLKGAALFTIWTGKPHRATRDLDPLAFGDPRVDHVREVFTEVLALDLRRHRRPPRNPRHPQCLQRSDGLVELHGCLPGPKSARILRVGPGA